MKKIYLFLLASASVFAAASCQQAEMEVLTTVNPEEATTLTLAFDATRTTLVDGKTTWVAGDKVRIYNSTGTFYNDITISEADAGKASIDVEVQMKDKAFFAVYPVEAANGISDGKIGIKIPTNPDGLFASANICVAETGEGGTTLRMRNATAILKLKVASGNVVEILQFSAQNPMVGTYTVDLSGEAPALTAVSGSKSATVAVGGVDGDYYIPVAPGTYAENFTATALKGNGGYQTLTSTKVNEIAMNTIVDMGSIGNDLSTGLNGEGTEASPYLISNLGEWGAFTASVNLGNPYTGKYISLGTDVEDVRTPIGYYLAADDQAAFAGTFLGNNHTVTVDLEGINCKAQTYVALFGVVDEGATVKDLKVKGTASASGNYTAGIIAYVRGTASGTRAVITNLTNEVEVTSTGNRIGGVVGYANYATITNCTNSASITGGNCVAGVIGKASNATMEKCTNTGAVTSTGNDTRIQYCYNGSVLTHGSGEYNATTGSHATGGICGFVDHGSLQDCSNTGAIKGYVKIGGVVGGTYWSPVTKCINSGDVTATGAFNQNLASQQGYGYGSTTGGVVGWMYTSGAITDCENSGTVKGAGGLGGIVGFANCGNNTSSKVYISNCKNSGAVVSTGTTTGGATKNHNAATGGIAGSVAAFGPQVTYVGYCTNTANVSTDGVIAGGIVGRVHQSRNNGSAVNFVNKCVNTGNVTALYWTGGIVGMSLSLYNGVIRIANSYNTGTVTGNRSDDSGEVAGGILGANHVWNSYTNYGQVYNCYNHGDVIYDVVEHVKPYCGGIVGRIVSAGDIKNVYNTGFVGPKGKVEPASGASARLGALVGSLEAGLNYAYYKNGVCAQAVGTASSKTPGAVVSEFDEKFEFSGSLSYGDKDYGTLLDILNAWAAGATTADYVYVNWKAGTNGPEFE